MKKKKNSAGFDLTLASTEKRRFLSTMLRRLILLKNFPEDVLGKIRYIYLNTVNLLRMAYPAKKIHENENMHVLKYVKTGRARI